jgi:hypothetical protein
VKRTVLVLLALVACGGTKREAAGVVSAVDRFREADNGRKAELADALDQVPCTDAEVCATKNACTAAADPTAKGLRLQHEVEQGLADVNSGKLAKDDPVAQGLAGKLEESNRLREQGDKALDDCNQKLTALRMKYEL